jgi:hypothetical protein
MAASCLTDLRYDRRDRHASGKGEGKDHNHEYLFHWIIPLFSGISKRHHAEHSDVVLKGEYLMLRAGAVPAEVTKKSARALTTQNETAVLGAGISF